MDFTYEAYENLVCLLKNKGYVFCNYRNHIDKEKCVIMRHDIDYSITQAVKLAELENNLGVSSTYFVLLSSDFYNPASAISYEALHRIKDLGHDIGLHFDETAYEYNRHDLEYHIKKEAEILSSIIDMKIESFSLHRPNHLTLENEMEIPNLVNSYGNEFFCKFKYLSDSRCNWREPVEEIISSNQFERLHILTHAFWYHSENKKIDESILDFIELASAERRTSLEENITNLELILQEGK